MSTKSARTTNMKMIVCDPEAEAGSHHCWPSTNIQTHRGGAQLLPRHTTCSRSHKLLVSSQTNYWPSSLSTQGLLISCASWGLSPPTFTRARKPSIMQKLVRLSQGNHGINWRLVGGVYSFSWILSCSTSRPGHTCMMMIAFITIKSSLVPLIEGLCAQIYFRFEISVVCSHLLLFYFVK